MTKERLQREQESMRQREAAKDAPPRTDWPDNKSQQLGMHFSTAQARLDRMVLFQLVQATGRDTCFRCGSKIVRYQDLSTDHKEPWLRNSNAMFWDLANIAFSHKTCNGACAGLGRMPVEQVNAAIRRRIELRAFRITGRESQLETPTEVFAFEGRTEGTE